MTTHELATILSGLSATDLASLDALLAAEQERRLRQTAVARARTYSLFPAIA